MDRGVLPRPDFLFSHINPVSDCEPDRYAAMVNLDLHLQNVYLCPCFRPKEKSRILSNDPGSHGETPGRLRTGQTCKGIPVPACCRDLQLYR